MSREKTESVKRQEASIRAANRVAGHCNGCGCELRGYTKKTCPSHCRACDRKARSDRIIAGLTAKVPTKAQIAAVLDFCKAHKGLYESLLSRCESYRRAGKFPAFGELCKERKIEVPLEGTCGACGNDVAYGHWRVEEVKK